MERVSKRARLTFVLLLSLSCLAAAGARAPKQGPPQLALPKNATGCTFINGTHYSFGSCVGGEGGCYYCEHTDPGGTYGCYEAPNPADGISCFPIYYQIAD